MNEKPELARELVGNEELFRALRSKAQLDDKRRAFLLRTDEKETGLSVRYACTSDDCENELKKSYGVLSLTAQRVHDLNIGLRVVPDELTHANIKGLSHTDDNFDEAMRMAGQLSNIAQVIREGLRHRPASDVPQG